MHVRRFGDGGVWRYLDAVDPSGCFEAGIWSFTLGFSVNTVRYSHSFGCDYFFVYTGSADIL